MKNDTMLSSKDFKFDDIESRHLQIWVAGSWVAAADKFFDGRYEIICAGEWKLDDIVFYALERIGVPRDDFWIRGEDLDDDYYDYYGDM
jgi:hypothetical protein